MSALKGTSLFTPEHSVDTCSWLREGSGWRQSRRWLARGLLSVPVGVIGTRPQESHIILGNVGITTSVECGDADLVRRGGSSHPTGGDFWAKGSHHNWNRGINSRSRSPGPWTAGVSTLPTYLWRWIFFSFNKIFCLQSLDQVTGLSGEGTSPSLCPWFWLRPNCLGAHFAGARIVLLYSFLQVKLLPCNPPDRPTNQ